MKKLNYFFYVIVFILCFFGFFSFKYVNAATGIVTPQNSYSDILFPIRAQFYDATVDTPIPTNSNMEQYALNTQKYVISNNYQYYYTSDNRTYKYLSFDTLTPILSDSVYSMTIYLGYYSNSSVSIADVNRSIQFGNSSTNFDFWQASTIYNYGYADTTIYDISDIWNFDGEASSNQTLAYGSTNIIKYIFTTPNTSTSYNAITIPFNYAARVNFYGYSLEYLGSSQSVTKSELASVESSINNEINEMNSSIEEQTQQQQQNHQETMDTITSSETDDPSESFEEFDSYLSDNGVITSLIVLPVKFFQSILNSFNYSCQPFSLGELFDTEIILPCITLQSILGSSLTNTIDYLLCGFFVIILAKKFIKIFNNFSSLEEGDILDD